MFGGNRLLAGMKSIVKPRNGRIEGEDAVTRYTLLSLMLILGIGYLFVFGAVAWLSGDPLLCAFDLLCAVLLAANFFYMRESGDYAFASACSVFLMGLLFLYMFVTGDPASGGHLWILVFPLIAFFPLGRKAALAACLVVLAAVLGFMLADRVPESSLCYTCLFKFRFVAIYLVIMALVYIYERLRARARGMEITKAEELQQAVDRLTADEEELKAIHKTLEDRVARRTSELVNANEKLRREMQERRKAEDERKRLETRLLQAQKMEAIGTLAGGVAHDLNNVLAGLVGYPDMLLMDMKPDDPLREPMEMIRHSGNRATAMVQDLLALAQRDVSVMEVMQLNGVITAFLISPECAKIKNKNPGLEIRTRLDTHLMNMKGVPSRMARVLTNMVCNAADAIEGAGEITIVTENHVIDKPEDEPVALDAGHYVRMIISDTGAGIPEEARERIFEPFYTKKKLGRRGTGLGLALVWHTVQDHHGAIQVENSSGGGTTFTLWFPATGEKPGAAADGDAGCVPGNQESVLVIDDVDVQRHVAVEMLRRLNYRAYAAASGEEGIEMIRKAPVDLILLDMLMEPGIDGLETYRRILEINPAQKAIIASGFSETRNVREALRLGAGAYVKKPYDMASLSRVIRNVLDG